MGIDEGATESADGAVYLLMLTRCGTEFVSLGTAWIYGLDARLGYIHAYVHVLEAVSAAAPVTFDSCS